MVLVLGCLLLSSSAILAYLGTKHIGLAWVGGPTFMPLMNMGHYPVEDISMIHDNRVGCIHSGTKNNSPIIVLGGSDFQPSPVTQEMREIKNNHRFCGIEADFELYCSPPEKGRGLNIIMSPQLTPPAVLGKIRALNSHQCLSRVPDLECLVARGRHYQS
jgi:hypothetical protein